MKSGDPEKLGVTKDDFQRDLVVEGMVEIVEGHCGQTLLFVMSGGS